MLTVDHAPAPYRALCTDCGVSRMADPKACGSACQFIAPDYAGAEMRIHGRARNDDNDEVFFGVNQAMWRARMKTPADGAQWTGITTGLAERLLRGNHVDAVLTMKADSGDRWKPVPVIVTNADDLAQCRGMRMGYAPLLALLEPAIARGLTRLAVVALPCQSYALRALEKTLGLDALYVIGTPCSDNTTTENFHKFLAVIDDAPETITYLEFRADYHVELRYQNGQQRLIPFLKLPLSDLPSDFFPTTCQTCVDYTNVLADITVGYMGGDGEQWVIVRNAKGQAILDLMGDDIALSVPTSKGKRDAAVKGFMANVERAAGGLPLRKMPNFLRPIVAWLQPRTGPRGLEFARTRVEMKAIESVLHLRRKHPALVKRMVPAHIWRLVERYGLMPDE
jgi:coenzyme F420 hydrogenase subunit beta